MFIKTTFNSDLNHILNCVNKCDFGTKCFAKVEHFVLRLIEVMRTEQMANKIKNQNFFQRNLFPRMFGWFLIRLVDREFECSTSWDYFDV